MKLGFFLAAALPLASLSTSACPSEPPVDDLEAVAVTTVYGPEVTAARFGETITEGDLDNDLRPDVIVSAPRSNETNVEGAELGTLYIFYNLGEAEYATDADVTIIGDAGDEFGASVNIGGDLDRDGYSDLIIGAPADNNGNGSVYVLYGPVPNGTINVANYPAGQKAVFAGTAHFGREVLTANGGGTPVLIFLNDNTIYKVAARRYTGTNIPIATSASLIGALTVIAEATLAADFGNSGTDTLVIGAPSASSGKGQVCLITLSTFAVFRCMIGTIEGGGIGSSLAVGQLIGNDNDLDLVYGSVFDFTNIGQVAGATILPSPLNTQAGGVTTFLQPKEDGIGATVATGDYNVDGITDLAIGLPNYYTQSGKLMILNGPLPQGGTYDPTSFATHTLVAPEPFEQAGLTLRTISRNGYEQIVVGAPNAQFPDGNPGNVGRCSLVDVTRL